MTRIGAEQTTGSLVVMLFLLGFFREIVANDRYPRAAVSYISFSSSSFSRCMIFEVIKCMDR